jgi:hypothetical protein
MKSSYQTAMFNRFWSKNRNILLKVVGFSTAAALTLKLFYIDTFATSNSSFASQTQSEKLVSVHLLTRHGARTPLHIISVLEEVIKYIFMIETRRMILCLSC